MAGKKDSNVRERKNAKKSSPSSKENIKKVLKQKGEVSGSGRLIFKLVGLVLVGGGGWYYHTTIQNSSSTSILARSTETLSEGQFQEVECSNEYRKKAQSGAKGCVPTKCGRFIIDDILSKEELAVLQEIATEGTMIAGGGAGGASIIEMHTSSASAGEQFISLFNRAKQGHVPTIDAMEKLYSNYNLRHYKQIRHKVQKHIGDVFGIDPNLLHLAAPTFFSRLTNKPPKTPNDEYWHKHVDTLQYRVFHYTALFYLSDYGTDFQGGRFIFDKVSNADEVKTKGLPSEQINEPKTGRLSFFTSGAENPHHVEKVTDGTRYAFTMGFTCNAEYKIPDPHLPTEIVNAKVPDQ